MTLSVVRRLPGPARLEAFSDGVLAIVITLLVLEIKVPHIDDPQSAQEALGGLVRLAPKLLGYVLSFLFIAVFWINHHRFFQLIARVDNGLLWLNMLLLLAMSFIPFPTAFVGEYPWNGLALALFGLVLMVAGLAFHLMWRRARSHGLLHADVDVDTVRQAIRRGMVGPALYAVAAIVAFVLPIGAWTLCVSIPIYYALPRHQSQSSPGTSGNHAPQGHL